MRCGMNSEIRHRIVIIDAMDLWLSDPLADNESYGEKCQSKLFSLHPNAMSLERFERNFFDTQQEQHLGRRPGAELTSIQVC